MAARCPNCTRKLHIWNNHSGFCSKRCREESRSACLNCGKVGLFKHERLGCCSDECRYWYVTTLLGYDREFLLTPAWDKVVYHVRLPSSSAEISSLQLDELEFERALETILVVAAPAWISRQKVLAELPYKRFDNTAWQHLRMDGTLTPEEIERFRGMCYDDPLLYHKLGVHVFEKIRGQGGTSPIMPSTSTQLAPGGVALSQQLLTMDSYGSLQTAPMDMLTAAMSTPQPPPLQLTQVSQAGASLPAPDHFAAQVRTVFALRGYEVAALSSEVANTLLLTKGGKRAIAMYHWEPGMVSDQPVRPLLDLLVTWEATHGYFVTNGHFTLQVEDLVADRPIQLVDGTQFATLVDGGRSAARPAALGDEPAAANGKVHPNGTDEAGGDNTVHLNGSAPANQDAGVTQVIAAAPAQGDQDAKTQVISTTPQHADGTAAAERAGSNSKEEEPQPHPAENA
ncbi:MAG: hypothetical protein JWO42_2334 [Chloroflexi bacterium]|nr:hypothetical protein [Chloroflexota bacterium]